MYKHYSTVKPKALPVSFFNRDTVEVAKALLGQTLVHNTSAESMGPVVQRLYKIVETEAYTQEDPACHAYQKKPNKPLTPRASMLYALPGTAYVYLIYGMYHCLNVITEPEGRAGAVLIRALQPLVHGREAASAIEFKNKTTQGPGRLTRTLGITRQKHNGLCLTQETSEFYLAKTDFPLSEAEIVTTTRIGIRVAMDWPWRFYISNNPYVSVLAKEDAADLNKRVIEGDTPSINP